MNNHTSCFLLLLTLLFTLPSRADVLLYPAGGNIDPRAGTIDFWIRLETEPVNGQSQFPILTIGEIERPVPLVSFTYQNIWKPEHFHFFFSTVGLLNGQNAANPYVTTAEDTQAIVKGESGANRYPRVPRLHKGDWHHLAITWAGLPRAIVTIYFDGRPVFLPTELQVPLWTTLDDDRLMFRASPYHAGYTLDDLHISAIARSPEWIKAAFERRKAEPDRFTLLLDSFDNVEKDAKGRWVTHPQVICRTADGIGGREHRTNCLEWVDGIHGKGFKTLPIYKK